MAISKDRLIIARQDLGLAQYELAAKISEKLQENFAKSNVSLWERGRRNIPMKYLDILAEILSVDPKYLLGENVEKDGTPILSLIETEEEYIEVAYSELFMYDGMPIFVKFMNGERENAWAIFDRMTGVFVFANQKVKANLNLSKIAKFYLRPDLYVQYSSLYKNALNMTQFRNAENIYIRSTSGDNAVRNRIDGWYHHNADKTCLVDDKGNALEYNMLGVTYMAYSEGRNCKVVK